MGQNYLLVYAINHDARNGKVEMIANNYKLTISQEGEATTAKEDGGKEKGTKPAAQGGGGRPPRPTCCPEPCRPRRSKSSRSDGTRPLPTVRGPRAPGRGRASSSAAGCFPLTVYPRYDRRHRRYRSP